ncbi:MAG: efflux RND transporter periplasmic adaptor subunit [Candidatus Cryptobacteroides sp.]
MKLSKIILIGAVIWGMTACKDRNAVKTAEVPQAKEIIQTEKLQETDAVSGATNVANKPTFNGLIDVDPRCRATVTVSLGGTVHSMNVLSGQHIRKGETIATLDNPEYINLQQEYLEATAKYEYLKEEYSRQQSLSDQDAVSKKTFQQTKADFRSISALLTSLKARLEVLGTDMKSLDEGNISPYLSIKSPISGYVAKLDANLGKYIDVGQPFCEIIDKSSPRLVLTIYEKDLSYIATGKKVEFKINGMDDKTFGAVITAADQVVDQNDYSIKIYADIKDSFDGFRPGMYVRARIID